LAEPRRWGRVPIKAKFVRAQFVQKIVIIWDFGSSSSRLQSKICSSSIRPKSCDYLGFWFEL
jgi:hypothetical protein